MQPVDPRDTPKNGVSSSSHKRRSDKRTFLLIGGELGLILLLIVVAVSVGLGNTVWVTSPTPTSTTVESDSTAPAIIATVMARTQGVAGTSASTASASDTGNQNRFVYGQAMYWASMRYHQLTGYWVPWDGNPSVWPSQAASYGWIVSAQPHIPSIIVFAPYVQGAASNGHVGVAESMDGTDITTSNWDVAGSGAGITVYLRNQAGSGVSFIYHPGS